MDNEKMVKIFIGIEDTWYRKDKEEMKGGGGEAIVNPDFVIEIERSSDRKIITIGELRFKQIK